MSQNIYIIFANAETAGILVPAMIESHCISKGEIAHRNNYTLTETPPDNMTDEWFYNHLSIDTESNATQVVCIDRHPRYDIVREMYPTAKLITVTHTLDELRPIAFSIFQGYYVKFWEFEQTQTHFRNLISVHPQFFPDINVSPSELSNSQFFIVNYLISYGLLLKNLHSVVLPADDLNHFEIKFNELMHQPSVFKSKMSNILGEPLSYAATQSYNQFLKNYLNVVLDRYNK